MQMICRHVPRGHVTHDTPRSHQWPAVERAFLVKNPACRGCGGRHDLNVHHIRPFHLHPELELDESNLVTVCRRCHFVLCHLNNWSWYDPDCLKVLAEHTKKREAASGRADRPPDHPGSRLAGPPDEHRAHDRHGPGGGGGANQLAG